MDHSKSHTARPELIGIQYLRGIAALAVVLDHSSGMASLDKYFGTPVLDGLLTYGYHGVDIFFVLSGFIIVYVSRASYTLAPTISPSTFLLRRAIRILPLMWLAILSFATLRALAGIDGEWIAYLKAATLYPIGDVAPGNIWTLRHEFLFYLLFALTLLPASALRVVLVLWFLAPLALALASFANPVASNDLLKFICSPVNLEFGIGALLGAIFVRKPNYDRDVNGHFLILVIGVSLLIFTTWATSQELGGLPATVFAGAFSAPIVAFAAFFQPRRINRVALLLGEASYAIYLFHPHFQSAMLKGIVKFTPWMGALGAAMIVACLSTVAGILIHLSVEKPMIRRLQKSQRLRPSAVDRVTLLVAEGRRN